MVTVLLLFCISLVTLYSARVSVTEQRLSANDVQARAALAAAQAGLDRVLAGLATLDRSALEYDPDGWAVLGTQSATLANGTAFSAWAHNRGLTSFQSNLLRIESQGSFQDAIGTRSLGLIAAFSPLLTNIPPAPLVVRGNMTAAGGLTLGNAARPAAAWMGGAYTPGATPPDIQLADPPWCPPFGICDGDNRIGSLTQEEFFANTFGRPPQALRSSARVLRCAHCDPGSGHADYDVIWLENDGAAVRLTAEQLGTEERPVVAVIDGDMEPAGPVRIHGLLFVLGDWLAGDGAIVAEGSIIVAGDAVDIGPAQLVYHPGAMDYLRETGRFTPVPGSWVDF